MNETNLIGDIPKIKCYEIDLKVNRKAVSNMSYNIFSDESSYNQGQFRSISAVSGISVYLNELTKKLDKILEEYNRDEIKWSKVRKDYRKKEVANKFLNSAIDLASQGKIRVDTIIWDTRDSRHKIKKRDDIKNFKIMYYNLLRHIAKAHSQREWEFYPDEQSAINWENIRGYINNTYERKPGLISLFREKSFQFDFKKIKEKDSKEESIIQLADLFAGLSRFSRQKSYKFNYWKNCIKNKQQCLFTNEKELSNADKGRFDVLYKFYRNCRDENLGVSINSKKYLDTPDPWGSYINFWHYEPQHKNDIAPTK